MSASVSEKELLSQLKAGDEKAVAAWFRLYSPKLKRLVSGKIDSPFDIEEIVQETFINCLKHLPLFRGESSIWTWMSRIANHEIADFYRKRYAKKAIRALQLDELIPVNNLGDAHDVSLEVQAVLAKLDETYSQVLTMKYIEGLSVAQMAQELQKSVKAVESELFRARLAFRQEYSSTNL